MRNLGSNTMDQRFEITPFDLSGLSWPSVGRRRPSRLSLPSLAIDTWRGGEKTGRHRVRRGIRGPSADEIAIRPAKAERVCMVSPLEEDGFELGSLREGKGYEEPLHASIAVSGLNL
jgi:hypothetical protein